MQLSAAEVRSVEFAVSRKGGYDQAQVDQFLERVAGAIQEFQGLLHQADERVRQYAAVAAQQQNVSDQMAEVRRLAQPRAQETLPTADAQARQLLAEAEARAAHLDQEVAARRHGLEEDIRALLAYEDEYRARLRAALEAQLRLLDETRGQPPGPAPELAAVPPAAQPGTPAPASRQPVPQQTVSAASPVAPQPPPIAPAPAPQGAPQGQVVPAPQGPAPAPPGVQARVAPQGREAVPGTGEGFGTAVRPAPLPTVVQPEAFQEQVHVVRQGMGLEDDLGGAPPDAAAAAPAPATQTQDVNVNTDAAAGLFRRLSHE